jgi:hypothetical protein
VVVDICIDVAVNDNVDFDFNILLSARHVTIRHEQAHRAVQNALKHEVSLKAQQRVVKLLLLGKKHPRMIKRFQHPVVLKLNLDVVARQMKAYTSRGLAEHVNE